MSLFDILISTLFYLLNASLTIGGTIVLVNNPIFEVCEQFGDYAWVTVLMCVINHMVMIAIKFHKELYNNQACIMCFNLIIIYNCISTNLIYYLSACDKYSHIYDFLFIETIFNYGAVLYLLCALIYMFYYICKVERELNMNNIV